MELSIDTASDVASVALSDDGSLLSEITWRCRRNHTVELLPTIERLLEQSGAAMSGITAVFACNGPGMYTGLRVGVSTAKGIATGLEVPALGVGRLELDAYPHLAFPGTVVAVHRAGRGELAWASYAGVPPVELTAPQLAKPAEVGKQLSGPTLLVGEVDDETLEGVGGATTHDVRRGPAVASIRRAGALAEIGSSRLRAGAPSDAALLVAVYLRPPAIGPQPPPA